MNAAIVAMNGIAAVASFAAFFGLLLLASSMAAGVSRIASISRCGNLNIAASPASSPARFFLPLISMYAAAVASAVDGISVMNFEDSVKNSVVPPASSAARSPVVSLKSFLPVRYVIAIVAAPNSAISISCAVGNGSPVFHAAPSSMGSPGGLISSHSPAFPPE